MLLLTGTQEMFKLCEYECCITPRTGKKHDPVVVCFSTEMLCVRWAHCVRISDVFREARSDDAEVVVSTDVANRRVAVISSAAPESLYRSPRTSRNLEAPQDCAHGLWLRMIRTKQHCNIRESQVP